MIGLKRYIRPGLVVSVGGHLAALIVGLFFVGAMFTAAQAMVVEVATSTRSPLIEGTPSARHSSGSTSSPSVGKGAVTQAPPPAPRPQPQPQQQAQQRPTPQREAKEAAAQNLPVPEAAQAELVRAEKTEPKSKIRSKHSLPQSRRSRHRSNPTSPKRSHNTWRLADRSAVAFPRRRSTPTYLATTGPRRSGNVSARVRRSRRKFGEQGHHQDTHFLQP